MVNIEPHVLDTTLSYIQVVYDLIPVLVETLKVIRGLRIENQKVFRAPDPRTKYFSVFHA